MKYIKNINEIAAKYNREEDKFVFDPTENSDNAVTFYLHKDKLGFVMEISVDDKDKLEEILNRNNIDYTVSTGNVLPF